MFPTGHQVRCSNKGLRHLAVALRLTIALAAAILSLASAQVLCGQDQKQPSRESSLDRAVRELGEPDARNGAPPASVPSNPTSALSAPTGEAEAGAADTFLASWRLFRYSYLEGWLVGLLLSLVGVVVVVRDQIFIGAAVSQASTLGIALALCASSVFPLHDQAGTASHSSSWLCCDSFQAAMAVCFSMFAALVTSRAGRASRESHEAITGWVFLVSASLSVLVVARSPHGLEEIYRIHSSSIIGATATDVAVFTVLLAITATFVAATRRRLLLFVTDPPMASAVGMKVGRWAVLESLWLGLAVGLSIRASGMLFTFGSLVLPPLVAKNLCREVAPMFVVAPAVSLVANTLGFVLAHRYDFPPAQMNVALAGLLLLIAWLVRGLRRVK
jgi:ABC-type Mn2+/Zn2+ transport system permease subunit